MKSGESIEWLCPFCRGGHLDIYQAHGNAASHISENKEVFQSNVINEIKSSILDLQKSLDCIKNTSIISDNLAAAASTSLHDKSTNLSDYKKALLMGLDKAPKSKTIVPHTNNISNTACDKHEPSVEKHIVFAKGIKKETFLSSLDFKIFLSKAIPGLKIVHIYMKINGTVCIFLKNKEDMLKLAESWSKLNIPDSSAITVDEQIKNNAKNKFLIVKDVPQDMTDSYILNSLKETYPSILSVKSFIKNYKKIPMAIIEFKSLDDFDNALENGLIIDYIFLQTQVYHHFKKPSFCNNCANFNHTTKSCSMKSLCFKCGSSDHIGKDCTSTVHKCNQCGGNHPSASKTCEIYNKLFQKLNSK